MLSGLRFVTTLANGTTKDLGTVLLVPSGGVKIDVAVDGLQQEMEAGLIGANRRTYYPKDGIKFLEAALRQYSGSYVRARGIYTTEPRMAGGPGSGNFGHGGRPGERGGSSSGDGGVVYKQSSGIGAGPQSYDASRPVVVHQIGKSGTNFEIEGPTTGHLTVHKDDRGFVLTDGRGKHPDTGGRRFTRNEGAYPTKEEALAKAIKLAKERVNDLEDADKWSYDDDLENLGGPGSGNFGHGGRPGEVGGSAQFSGKSADGKFEGTTTVKIVNPHSNAHKVTETKVTGKRTRMYEGANVHIPTATVEMDRSKRGLPPLQFEAYHHTLKADTAPAVPDDFDTHKTDNPHKSTFEVGTEIQLERKGKPQMARLVRKEHHGEEWRIHNEKDQYVYSEGFRYVTEHRKK